MKKKIFIWMTSMHLGGAERALVGLLDAFDYDKVNVDLFLNRHEGELLEDIPKEVNLLPENIKYKSLSEPMVDTIKRGELLIVCGRVIGKVMTKLKSKKAHNNAGISGEYSNKYTKSFMPKINPDVEYDLAISFITPHYFTAEKVNAKKRIAWIHTDYSKISLDIPSQTKMWNKYDYLASISDEVTNQFLKCFPSLKDKIVRIDNILPTELIRKQAKEVMDFDSKIVYNLLSIGRYSYAKNFENIPLICHKLVDLGFNIRWAIIGYGDYERIIRDSIEKNKMSDYVILLGKKDNPYPYIKNCDLYVQPSRYEGNSVCVKEAQLLAKPVVITNYPTSKSQLEDGVDGIIVPMDNDGCANAIADLIKNPKKMKMLSDNCKKRDYSNKSEVNKIYSLLS